LRPLAPEVIGRATAGKRCPFSTISLETVTPLTPCPWPEVFRKVDCFVVRVPSIQVGLEFYERKLGHQLVWRRGESAAGLHMPESETELVLLAEEGGSEADLLVDSVGEAVRAFLAAGGSIQGEVEDIPIGKRATLRDPWGNTLLILDMTNGPLRTDSERNVVELGR
jgi:catechol 2,3-dioxygenase-like lactoylglutathione lyase family enzyme